MTNTEWIKSVAGATYFRFVDGVKYVKLPAVGNVAEVVFVDPRG